MESYVNCKVAYSNCDDVMRERVYGVFDKVSPVGYRPYCSLKKAIVGFYVLELDYSMRKMKPGSFWTDRHENYYRSELIPLALNLIRFTLAACVGEARHGVTYIHKLHKNGEHFWNAQKIFCGDKKAYAEKYKRAMEFLRFMFGGMGYDRVPEERVTVYMSYIPEGAWLRYMAAARHVFHEVWWGGGAVGGAKWGNAVDHAIRLYRAVCVGSFSDIAISFDTLINHFHNCGLLLDKFDCSFCSSIQDVLSLKQQGEVGSLEQEFEMKPCLRWGEYCYRVLRDSPIGGSNGQEKMAIQDKAGEEKEGTGWVVFDKSFIQPAKTIVSTS